MIRKMSKYRCVLAPISRDIYESNLYSEKSNCYRAVD